MAKCEICGDRLPRGAGILVRRSKQVAAWINALHAAGDQAREADVGTAGLSEAADRAKYLAVIGKAYRASFHQAAHKNFPGALPFERIDQWHHDSEEAFAALLSEFDEAGLDTPDIVIDDSAFE